MCQSLSIWTGLARKSSDCRSTAPCITKGEQNTLHCKILGMMGDRQLVSQDTPSNVRDIPFSGKRFGTWFAENNSPSDRMRRASRLNTRLRLSSAKF